MNDRDTLTIETDTVIATEDLAARLAGEILNRRGFERGVVFLLSGPLGAGKTAFVRGLARGLGARTTPKSPTFALHHAHEGARRLDHFDLYRIEEGSRADDLGLDELFAGDSVVAVEWAERLGARTPESAFHVSIESGEGDLRKIVIAGPRARMEAFKTPAGTGDVLHPRH